MLEADEFWFDACSVGVCVAACWGALGNGGGAGVCGVDVVDATGEAALFDFCGDAGIDTDTFGFGLTAIPGGVPVPTEKVFEVLFAAMFSPIPPWFYPYRVYHSTNRLKSQGKNMCLFLDRARLLC